MSVRVSLCLRVRVCLWGRGALPYYVACVCLLQRSTAVAPPPQLTYADICVFDFFETSIFRGFPTLLEGFPELAAFVAAVNARPAIKARVRRACPCL